MESMPPIWSRIDNRAWWAALALACLGLVLFSLEMTRILHLSPCPLCIFQRLLFIVLAVLAAVAAICPKVRPGAGSMFAGVSLMGVGVATYQSWMQAFPEYAKECSFTDPGLIEKLVDMLGMQWPGVFLATGFCTSKEWIFLGLSMANWAFLMFAGFTGFAIYLLRRRDLV